MPTWMRRVLFTSTTVASFCAIVLFLHFAGFLSSSPATPQQAEVKIVKNSG